ncbi:MAG: FxsA family protein [Thermoleophilaceae bacterium]
MPLLLVVLFVVVPLVELFVIIQVGQVIGAWWTIAILLADSILGSLLLRSQGRAVWRRFNAVMGEGRVPHREILDGVMIILGGALLLTPGFLTDVFGLLLLAPPTRAAIRRVLGAAALPPGRLRHRRSGRRGRLRRRSADVAQARRRRVRGAPPHAGRDPGRRAGRGGHRPRRLLPHLRR